MLFIPPVDIQCSPFIFTKEIISPVMIPQDRHTQRSSLSPSLKKNTGKETQLQAFVLWPVSSFSVCEHVFDYTFLFECVCTSVKCPLIYTSFSLFHPATLHVSTITSCIVTRTYIIPAWNLIGDIPSVTLTVFQLSVAAT